MFLLYIIYFFHYMHSFLNWSVAHSILVCCGILLYCGLDVLVVHAKKATPVQYRSWEEDHAREDVDKPSTKDHPIYEQCTVASIVQSNLYPIL
ncbi:hypothetical protein L873DRAFT_1475349 [Choiromyces venosus 120613-1]|uniref:Uncharacterized protein n=1 Tax=Choiromyces venosus 120613-1 TaxID=1336337 RepID=A0A3N4JCK0_9PEZI|nr:hypothetical protein L873DRAFT_1475349 [Choiromyces venosus 120613-1]